MCVQVPDELGTEYARTPVWMADIARTGWYGFPAVHGLVKTGLHGNGYTHTVPVRDPVCPVSGVPSQRTTPVSVPSYGPAPAEDVKTILAYTHAAVPALRGAPVAVSKVADVTSYMISVT